MEPSDFPLRRGEVIFSMIIYGILFVYGLSSVYLASWEKENVLSFDLRPGWLGRSRDTSDFEWKFWTTFFATQMKWFIGHGFLSVTLCRYFTKARPIFYILYTFAALLHLLAVKQVMVLVAQFCCVYLSALTRRRICVWIVSILFLALINISSWQSYLKALAPIDSHPKDQKYICLVYIIALNGLRQVSFAVDMCKDPRLRSSAGLLEAFAYVFYYPTLTSGPFMSYGVFRKSLSQPSPPLSPQQLYADLLPFLRPLTWWFVGELVIHHFYFSALQEEEYYLMSAPNMTVFSISILQLAFFQLKYVFLYSFTTSFAKLDQVDTPPPPQCVMTKHTTLDIWRTFDVGLYRFIRDYIYFPLGGAEKGRSLQTLISFACFTYIGFWHGGQVRLMYWALINFLIVSIERFLRGLPATHRWKKLESQFGPRAVYRLLLILKVPVCVVSLWSVITFVGGSSVALNLYRKLVRYGGLNSNLCLLIFGYFVLVAQIGFERKAYLRPPAACPVRKNHTELQRNSTSPRRPLQANKKVS